MLKLKCLCFRSIPLIIQTHNWISYFSDLFLKQCEYIIVLVPYLNYYLMEPTCMDHEHKYLLG